jgi:hypothetical protein
MTNPILGVVTFTSGGKSYSLRFDANVVCDAEDEFGAEFFDEIMAKGKASASQMRRLFWLALKQRHPELESDRDAGALVNYGQMIALIQQAAELGSAENEQVAGRAANPQHPGRDGTGPISTSGGARQASTRTPSGAKRPGSSS